MLLDLSRFRGDIEHFDRTYPAEVLAMAGEDFRLVAPVHLVLDVRKDSRKVRLTGRLETTLECDCSRCLEPFAVPVDVAIDSIFLPADQNTGGGEDEREIQEDDLGVGYYRDDQIDLGDVMREQFLLALPMKPLCGDACKGLCPECGVNRNREDCGGHEGWVDPRLEPLRRLRKQS
jgi:uncharacterized protein